MTLSQLECFIEVVKTGSFSKAASYLFMTQQGMSNQIRALEKELGFPVFIRLNRGVELTPEGKILYSYWKDAYEQIKTGIDKAKDEYTGGSKNIRVGIQDMGTVSEDIMTGFLEYEQLHPDLRVGFEIMAPRHMLELFEQGELDMAVLYASEFSSQKHLNSLAIHDTPFAVSVFFSKKHPLADQKNLSMYSFRNQTMGVLSSDVSLDFKKRQLDLFGNSGCRFTGKIVEYATRRHLELGLISGQCFTIAYRSMFDDAGKVLLSLPVPAKTDLVTSSYISIFWKEPAMEIKTRALATILRKKIK